MFTAREEIHFTSTLKCTYLTWLRFPCNRKKKKDFPFFVRLFLLNNFLPVFANTPESTASKQLYIVIIALIFPIRISQTMTVKPVVYDITKSPRKMSSCTPAIQLKNLLQEIFLIYLNS